MKLIQLPDPFVFLEKKTTEMDASIAQDHETLAKAGSEKIVGTVTSLGMVLFGLFLSFGPTYIQADIPWFSTCTAFGSILFLIMGVVGFYRAYPRFFALDLILIFWCIPASITLYLQPDVSLKMLSFVALAMIWLFILLRIPSLILLVQRWKVRKTLFSKKTLAIVLAAFSGGAAFCTAVLQVLPVIAQLFH